MRPNWYPDESEERVRQLVPSMPNQDPQLITLCMTMIRRGLELGHEDMAKAMIKRIESEAGHHLTGSNLCLSVEFDTSEWEAFKKDCGL